MQYYQDLITAKSFKTLQEFKRQYYFILIGGWAVFLYSKTLKSKDIDIIIDYQELDKIRNKFNLIKNDRLKKYEINLNEIDIDIYVPHYSQIGIPVEDIKNYTYSINGFRLPKLEILLILKQTAYLDRQGSAKGEKDKIDIISLLANNDFDFKFYENILSKYNLENYKQDLLELIKSINELKESNLNQYQYSKFKKKALKAFS